MTRGLVAPVLRTGAQEIYAAKNSINNLRAEHGGPQARKSWTSVRDLNSMKAPTRPLVLLAVCAASLALMPTARANILGQISDSISSLWSQKASKQNTAHQALKQASAKKQRAEFLHDRLEKTARLLDAANRNYENYFGQLNRTEARIVETRHRVQMVTARYKAHKARFGARLAALQKHGEPQMLSVILGSGSLADLSRRANFMRALSDHDAGLQADLRADRLELWRAQNDLMAQWGARARLARAAHAERGRVRQGRAQQEATWKQISRSKLALLQLAAAQQRASNDIGNQIQSLEARKGQIIADYEAQAARAAMREQTSVRRRRGVRTLDYAPADDGAFSDGPGKSGWVTPTRGRISSRYGMRFHPVLHREKLHTGDDIAAPYGSPFRAARGGRVLFSGWQTAYGNTIIVDNGNGTTTLYGHASKLSVRAGQPVRAGQMIGNVGSTGWSTGPHLHFEVRQNGRPIDPTKYLR